jgi:putative transposase
MPRYARKKSETGIYHIIIRGTNRQEIFHDDEDCLRFLETLDRYKKKLKFEVYGWCLMGNHIHLLLKEGEEEIAKTMKRIGVSFVWYYNWKYKSTGHLFQDRFKSENVETDEYLMTVIRYIHQNPVKAGIVSTSILCQWSSCKWYYGKRSYPVGLLDDQFILGLFSNDRNIAVEKFIEFNEIDNNDKCLEDEIKLRLTDEEAREEINKYITNGEITKIKSLQKEVRDEKIRTLREIEGVSQRQLARILGISQFLIYRA